MISYTHDTAAFYVGQLNSVPSIHIRCKTTARLRTTATLALPSALGLASLVPQAFSTVVHFGTRVSSTPAEATSDYSLTPSSYG